MTKREEKTLAKIFESFAKLVQEIPYEDLTIQDILNDSKVSRSTFYSHFKAKDELLVTMTNNIFDHVFSHSLTQEHSHDFSKSMLYDYRHLITHIFYHMRDEKSLIKSILSSKSSDIFLNELRKHLDSFIEVYLNNYGSGDETVPKELRKKIVIETFLAVLINWFNNDCSDSPETTADYFLKSIK